MARSVIVKDPKRWDYCRGEAGPIKRQHVWEEISREIVKDEEFDKDWIVVFQCSCGDEYVEIYNWNNLLTLEAIDLGIHVVGLDMEGETS